MLELKISGQTASELLTNALQVTALLLNGAKQSAPKAIEPQSDTPPAAEQQVVEAKPEPVVETPVKPARKPKAAKPDPKQVDLEEAIADAKPKEMPADGDVIPDLAGKPQAKPEPTFNDCKAALVSVYDNFIARAKAAGESDEQQIMAGKIAYAKQLVYGFGIQKLMDLKPEQYADFIAKAKPYIDGTAKMEAK